jgi:acyl-CoA synthetase (NDP forming)
MSKTLGGDTSGIASFYDPRSIAIIGASANPKKPGGKSLEALLKRGYAGNVFPVNPSYDEIAGLTCYPTILDVPGDVEMAIVSVPANLVPDLLEQCGAKGVKAVVLFTAGFSEVGGEGEALQQRISDLARKHEFRILGPNCLGLINVSNSVMASFAHIVDLEPIPGSLGLVTQSGAFGAMIYAEANEAGVGCSSFASVGNEADSEFSEFVAYLLEDPGTKVIGGYLEGARNGDNLRRVAEKALGLGKPIVMLKVGRTGSGARAASSHTGSLAGDDQIYDAFFRQTGIVRVDVLSELTAFAMVHRGGRDFRGRRVGILSGSGGYGVIVADKCESLGLSVPELGPVTRAELARSLPEFGSGRNPIDLTAQAGMDPSMLGKCLRALVADPDVDIILANAFFREPNGLALVKELIEIYESTSKAIVIMSHARLRAGLEVECVERLTRAGIPFLTDGLAAATAVAQLAWYQDKAAQAAARDEGPAPPAIAVAEEITQAIRAGEDLSEHRSKQILQGYGIPVTREALATSAEMAVGLARELGYPVALKVQSPEIAHKTEADGIRLDLDSDDAVRSAYREILGNAERFAPHADVQGVLVQEMLEGGVEVIIGATKDPVFGHAIMFGLGGIFVEVLRDVSFRIAPLTRTDAEEMIEEIAGVRVLQGVRGQPPADREAIVDALLRVSRLVTDHRDEIAELDINPLVVFPRGAKAVDALIRA